MTVEEGLDDEDIRIRQTMIPRLTKEETLEEVTNRIFVFHQVYKSHYHLKKHLKYFGSYWGFEVTSCGMSYVCTKY